MANGRGSPISAATRHWTTEEPHDGLVHELADCLWAVLVLAERYEVDLESAYVDTMDELEQRLS